MQHTELGGVEWFVVVVLIVWVDVGRKEHGKRIQFQMVRPTKISSPGLELLQEQNLY